MLNTLSKFFKDEIMMLSRSIKGSSKKLGSNIKILKNVSKFLAHDLCLYHTCSF